MAWGHVINLVHWNSPTQLYDGIYFSGECGAIIQFNIYTLHCCFTNLPLTTVAFPPTDLTYVVQDDFTSILLMWVPPSPLGDTTGYRISYTVDGVSSNTVDISDGTTSNYTLSGLEKGKDYNISIVGISDYFFSVSVKWGLIAIKG